MHASSNTFRIDLNRLSLFLLLLLFLVLFRLRLLNQLIVRSKWRSQSGFKRDMIELHLPIKVGLWLARSPRAAYQCLEITIREEIDPFSIRMPERICTVGAITRQDNSLTILSSV